VKLGATRPSKCFAHAADSAQVQEMGATFVEVAQSLAVRARAAPHSPAALQLGYLLGAMHRGAGRDFGVYYEAVRRVQSETAGMAARSPEFVRGERAGERSG
jgi:hypothetical protein